MKGIVPLLISAIALFFLIGSLTASYYDDGWYGSQSNDFGPYTWDSNRVVINFYIDKYLTIDLDVPNDDIFLHDEINRCISRQITDNACNASTLKEEVKGICEDYGIDDPQVELKSPYGDNSFIFLSRGIGISMFPTLKNGDMVVLNKTHDFQVGDIVAAVYPNEYGGIMKRVSVIRGDEVYLISDNVNGTFVKNGERYEYEGLRTWVSMSDIKGVLIDTYRDDDYRDVFEV